MHHFTGNQPRWTKLYSTSVRHQYSQVRQIITSISLASDRMSSGFLHVLDNLANRSNNWYFKDWKYFAVVQNCHIYCNAAHLALCLQYRYIIQCCKMLQSFARRYAVLQDVMLRCKMLHLLCRCKMLHYIVRCCTVLKDVTPWCKILHFVVRRYMCVLGKFCNNKQYGNTTHSTCDESHILAIYRVCGHVQLHT